MRRPRFSLAFLDGAIVLSGVAATAGAALVLEDALPLKEGRTFDLTRWVWTVLATGVLLVFVRLRQRRARTTGTLYYLRFLQEWMGDWHIDALARRDGQYLDQRVIGRWCTTVPEGRYLDVVEDVTAITAELQRSMNDDRSDTGFTVAPNLLLPVAVSIGFDLYNWKGLRLEELFGNQHLSWVLTDSSRIHGFAKPVCIETDHDYGDAQSVLVTVDLTGKGETTRPPGYYACHYRVGVLAAGAEGELPSRPVQITTVPPPLTATHTPAPASPDDLALVHPRDAVTIAVAAIRCALHEHPDRCVVVAARMPKTVALGVGWALANQATIKHPGCGHVGCRQRACLHPWTNLVVLQLNQDNDAGPYLFPRVHHGQPPLPHLVSRVGLGGA